MRSDETNKRPVVVFGLLHAGLALVRTLGRDGVPVEGIALRRHEFGLRSRYLQSRHIANNDDQVLAALRAIAKHGRPVLFPERDENVEVVLRRWDDVRELADVPLPDDPEITRRLRRKDLLPQVAADAGVSAPGTVPAPTAEAVRDSGLRPPFLLKPLEGQEFALSFGEKAFVADDTDAAVAAWKRAKERGFDTIVQELIPDSHDHVYSLFTYIGRAGEPLASVVGRKVRQGPLRFGTSAVFASGHDEEVHDLGLRLLQSAGYRGLGHVEFVRDPRDGQLRLLEVNTRPPIWARDRDGRHARHCQDRVRRSVRPSRRGGAHDDRARLLDLHGEGRLGLRADGPPARAAHARVPTPLPAAEQGARRVRG